MDRAHRLLAPTHVGCAGRARPFAAWSRRWSAALAVALGDRRPADPAVAGARPRLDSPQPGVRLTLVQANLKVGGADPTALVHRGARQARRRARHRRADDRRAAAAASRPDCRRCCRTATTRRCRTVAAARDLEPLPAGRASVNLRALRARGADRAARRARGRQHVRRRAPAAALPVPLGATGGGDLATPRTAHCRCAEPSGDRRRRLQRHDRSRAVPRPAGSTATAMLLPTVGAGYQPTYPTDRWFPSGDRDRSRAGRRRDRPVLSTFALPGSDHRGLLARLVL